MAARRSVSVVLFEGFEVLDVFGPVEVFGSLEDHFALSYVGPEAGFVTSAQGAVVVADHPYHHAPVPDVVLVPGGRGTRRLVADEGFCRWLGAWAARADLVCSVCTGAALLAAAGLLEGRRATTNKAVFDWVCRQGPTVAWVAEARWVHDQDRWTSSGVAAGLDMALALVAHLCGGELAQDLADRIETPWPREATWDPFAARYGLLG